MNTGNNTISQNQINRIFNTALDFHRKKDLKNAAKYYNKVAAIDPFYHSLYYHMGIVQWGMGRIDDAVDCYIAAICSDTNDAKSFFELGNLYFDKGKVILSILCFLRAIQIKSDFSAAHINMSMLLDRIENRQLWIAAYKKMIEQNEHVFEMGPLRIRVETSSACNLRCQHCPTGTNYNGTDRDVMTMETFNKIIDQIKFFKIINDAVLYLGGEPLMNKNLPLMCKRIKEETRVLRTLFNTNAMLLDEEKCLELSKANIDQIAISIDGRSPEENNRVRKGSDYAIVLKNTKMLKKYLPNTQIIIANTLIKRWNDPENPVTPNFLANDFSGFIIESTYAMEWPGLDFNKSSLKNIGLEAGPQNNFCKMLFTEMSVRSNGDVIICCYDILGQNVMGNINDSDLFSIWKGKAYNELRKAMLAQDIGSLPGICKRCIHFTGHKLIHKDALD